MRDAVGAVQSVMVLGGGSEIAQAIVDRLVEGRCRTVVLGARDTAALFPASDRWRRAGADVDTFTFDALDPGSHQAAVDAAFESHGDLDMVILAFGVLGDQATFDHDPVARSASWGFYLDHDGTTADGTALLAWTKIMREAVAYAFAPDPDGLDVDLLEGEVLPHNESVRAMNRRLGFTEGEPYEQTVDGGSVTAIPVRLHRDDRPTRRSGKEQ